MNRKQKGFSLIELLIVVAIILIIAAIAIPNLLRSKMAANEASAVGSLRTITTAAVTYNSTYGNGFPANLGQLGPANPATCDASTLLDSTLALAPNQKSGYRFAWTPGTTLAPVIVGCGTQGYVDGFVATATPIALGQTGQRSFCVDGSGVIRFDPAGAVITSANDSCDITKQALQ